MLRTEIESAQAKVSELNEQVRLNRKAQSENLDHQSWCQPSHMDQLWEKRPSQDNTIEVKPQGDLKGLAKAYLALQSEEARLVAEVEKATTALALVEAKCYQ
jgi:hypothetical protein